MSQDTAASDAVCAHLRAITSLKKAKRDECEECVKIGARWVHLRTCQEDGGTRCCDSSPNRHASKHAAATRHLVVSSAEPGETVAFASHGDLRYGTGVLWRLRTPQPG
jgi:ubiquitin-hydrolase Zn-finger-containing protein